MTETKKKKPDCYKCQYRGDVPGSCHSSCKHPEAQKGKAEVGSIGEFLAIFASVGRVPPVVLDKLGIVGNPLGIRKGWFNWPYNFDPTWLEQCKGFTAKQLAKEVKE